jgi:cyclohexanone monooxygenase
VAGFPNLFMITGPQSPSVFVNMILQMEHDVGVIATILDHMRRHGHDTVEPTFDAQSAWDAEVRAEAERTCLLEANSWWKGANVAGKPQVFMVYVGGFGKYVARVRDIVDAGFDGFVFDADRSVTQPS